MHSLSASEYLSLSKGFFPSAGFPFQTFLFSCCHGGKQVTFSGVLFVLLIRLQFVFLTLSCRWESASVLTMTSDAQDGSKLCCNPCVRANESLVLRETDCCCGKELGGLCSINQSKTSYDASVPCSRVLQF